MSHDFEDLNVSDIKVETSVRDLRGALSVRYARDAVIHLSLLPEELAFTSFGNTSEFSVRSVTDQPRVVIPRAWIKTSHLSFNAQSGAGNELTLVAPQAIIESGKPTSDVVTVVFFLNGLRFLPQASYPEVVQLGNQLFRFALVDDYVSLSKIVTDNWGAVATVIEAENVKVDSTDQVQTAIDDACWLLSFAFGTSVGCVRTDVFDNNNRIHTRLRQLDTAQQPFYSPLLIDQLQGELKHFLETAFGSFGQKADAYKLRNIIHILVEVAGQSVVSVEGLLLANVLEIIRYNFALNILVPRGEAVQDGDQFNRPAKKGKSKRLSFGEILDSFSKELRLSLWTPNRKRFIDFRNKIIHEGELVGSSFTEQRQNVLDVLHFCQVAVLALLDWDVAGGKYIPANEDPNRITRTTSGKRETVTLGINLKPFTR